MIVTDGVAILSIKIAGNILNPVLLWDEDSAILIDTGMPTMENQIILQIEKLGVPLDIVKGIIFTHHDLDHTGCGEALIHMFGKEIDVYAHVLDKPFIDGTERMTRLNFHETLEPFVDRDNLPKMKVTQLLDDGDELPFFGGLQVIHTPGHTQGHISIYHKMSKLMIAGDSLICANGELKKSLGFVEDLPSYNESLKKYVGFDVDKMVCFHGGLVAENVNEQLRRVVREL